MTAAEKHIGRIRGHISIGQWALTCMEVRRQLTRAGLAELIAQLERALAHAQALLADMKEDEQCAS